ncbi:single-stranded-DNA-specific exonuclease RecJ [Patescibacteria group bacterium]|nr:single-stranded-DNA-specific exonuclease RecJ [Patescibacteria group bacterium]
MNNLSLLGKKWIFPSENSRENLIENLKKIRGIEECGFHPPEKLKDLEKAAERIRAAMKNGERILIVGDYDADGVCASVILFKTLANLGSKVSVRLPDRAKHGYGLNAEFVREAKKLGVKLIITVDNGISATQEIELANSFGIDVIITDHHISPDELPNAFAIVNPRQKDCEYPEKNLSGAAVAYKLATTLLNQEPITKNSELIDELLALAAIGTLADVCELSGENRMIVTEGLKKIPRTRNPGLRKILANAGLNSKISSEDIGFRIAPRLNAAGRLDSPLIAFQALANKDGEKFADGLEKLNSWRQRLTEKLLAEVEERLGEIGAERILIAGGENFHPGIIGLAAGRLAEKYHRPAIVMSGAGGKFVGSCRSPLPEFNITEALRDNSDLLQKFGGHRGAAGFTLEPKNRAAFEKKMGDYARAKIKAVELIPRLEIDSQVEERSLSCEFFEELQTLAPFGAGNPEPLFHLENVELAEIRTVGNGEKHLRAKIGKTKITAIGFGLGEFAEELGKRGSADLVFQLSENEWNGNCELQLKMVDLR